MKTTNSRNEAMNALVDDWKRFHANPDADVPMWILPPKSCNFLKAICNALDEPVSAFEFGSGRSTHALRTVCHSVVSVEDSSEWLDKTEAAADATPRRTTDLTAVVPLSRCWNRLRPIESFDIKASPRLLASLQAASLILVDSPPNPAKREHALYQALAHSRAGCVTVIDDINVSATRRFCERIASQNRSLLSYWHLPLDHHLGIFLKLEAGAVSSLPTLREVAGAWMRA